jgi:tripartite-type tricarboxylate transporter receptor subunit TctC
MNLRRRNLLKLAGAAAAVSAIPRRTLALDYPTRPVRIVVAQAAGSGPDISARVMARALSERLGQQFFVENKPGAGQNIGTEAVVRSAPDGYTLLFSTAANTSNATLYENLEFNFIRDTVPIAGCLQVPNIVVVNPSLPAKNVPEFIAYARANPGKLNMASSGNGTSPHLAGELFKAMAGVNLVHVPYRGSTPAITDLMSGQVQVMFEVLASSIGHIRAGELRALAVTTKARSAILPDVPTVGEFLPGYEVSSWSGFVAPAKTPPEIIEKIAKEVSSAIADPQLIAKMAALGSSPMPMSPVELGKFIVEETEKWAKVIRAANIKPD